MSYQEITVIVVADGESHTFQMDPTDFHLEEHQEVEALRATSGEVLEMKKIGLPTLRIQGSYQSVSSLGLKSGPVVQQDRAQVSEA